MSKELGAVFKTLRNNCTLTQQQVADVLHIDRSTYAYYERGTTEPDLKALKKLASVFNVDATLLLPDEDGKIAVRVSDVTEVEGEKKLQKSGDELLDTRDDKIYTLSKEEKTFLSYYRVLTKEQKKSLKEFFENLDE
ncbi:MAG: helix-turn-helix domain-containing protein [Ruminococcus sp.]|nr:helix-turn-helix domain-containing protein [Ruminococcus sp.]